MFLTLPLLLTTFIAPPSPSNEVERKSPSTVAVASGVSSSKTPLNAKTSAELRKRVAARRKEQLLMERGRRAERYRASLGSRDQGSLFSQEYLNSITPSSTGFCLSDCDGGSSGHQ